MLSPLLLLLAGLLTSGVAPTMRSAASPAFPAARSPVPYAEEGDVGCYWTMHDPKEKWIRGGIGRGDHEPVFDLVDNAFFSWSDSGRHAIEVSTGDPGRRLPASAWASNAGGAAPGGIGFYMNADMRKLIGGATSVQIWKDGKPVFNAVLAKTPTAAELDACVMPPKSDDSDEE